MVTTLAGSYIFRASVSRNTALHQIRKVVGSWEPDLFPRSVIAPRNCIDVVMFPGALLLLGASMISVARRVYTDAGPVIRMHAAHLRTGC